MNITKKEFETIVKICERAEQLDIAPKERMTLIMDLENTHNSVGLNLEGLLAADDLNFAHDVVGIQNHINRETKELEDFFVPRYSMQKNVDLNVIIDKAKEKSDVVNQSVESGKNDIEKEV